jgi:hypothetical protein
MLPSAPPRPIMSVFIVGSYDARNISQESLVYKPHPPPFMI